MQEKRKTRSRATRKRSVSSQYTELFDSLDHEGRGTILKADILDALSRAGIHPKDGRVAETMAHLKELSDAHLIDFKEFEQILQHNVNLLDRVIRCALVIPDFESYKAEVEAMFTKVRRNKEGKLASYIPQLKRVPADSFGLSFCSIDGQHFALGDAKKHFAVQSSCKPINYCLALEEHGEKGVHQHIGREPSGHGFNELRLNAQHLPHNPMINAGAIMACSLIRPDLPVADRFDYVMKTWRELSGGIKPGFNNAIYLSEKKTADRNFALGYFMRENKAFPQDVDLVETLEFYFQCCSIELTAESMAIVAATLANGGVNPLTEKKVFSPETVKCCLSLMHSCGMYDFSGEFAFSVGLPAKSGVSGILMLVIPNVGGFAIWSPRLDTQGNSVRGIEFCKALLQKYNFHHYDSLVQNEKKIDPRQHKSASYADNAGIMCWASSQGDIHEVRRLVACGVSLDVQDYGGRTALHVATSHGQLEMVQYLLDQGVSINRQDHWGNTPLDDAYRQGYGAIAELLEAQGAKRMVEAVNE